MEGGRIVRGKPSTPCPANRDYQAGKENVPVPHIPDEDDGSFSVRLREALKGAEEEVSSSGMPFLRKGELAPYRSDSQEQLRHPQLR